MSEKSPIAIALEKRRAERKLHYFAASDFLSTNSEIEGKIAIWVPVKGEEMGAIVDAEKHAKKMANGESIVDRAFNIDNRTMHILWTCVRDGSSEEKARAVPAFKSVQWMQEHLTNDEIAILLNLVNVCIARESRMETSIETDTIDAYAKALTIVSDVDGHDPIRLLFSRCTREWIELFSRALAVRLKDAEDALREIHKADADG